MAITGKIYLDPNITNIFSGQSLEIVIKIKNTEKTFIKGIFLNLRGDIKIKWEDLDQKNKHGQILYFMQKYEDRATCVDQYINVQNMDVLPIGEHTYNVILNIPQQLPQSIESSYGNIGYEMILILKLPTGIDEILYRQPLEIQGYLNISRIKNSMPFRTIYCKSLCFGMCSIKPLRLCLILPATSFTPGDYIKYYAFVQSTNCLLGLKRLSVILCQTRRYRALKPKPKETQVHLCLPSKSHDFNRDKQNLKKIEGSIKLPETLPITTDEHCSIRITYKLQFIIYLKYYFTDGYVTVPITVGSHRDDMEQEKIGHFSGPETRIELENELAEICV